MRTSLCHILLRLTQSSQHVPQALPRRGSAAPGRSRDMWHREDDDGADGAQRSWHWGEWERDGPARAPWHKDHGETERHDQFPHKCWRQDGWSSQSSTATISAPPPDPARPAATAFPAICDDVAAPFSPRSHDAAVTAFANLNRLDSQALAGLRATDPRVAALIMARAPLDSARNPSAAITSRYPAAKEQIALATRLTTPATTAPATTDTRSEDCRRIGIRRRAVPSGELAAVRHALITYPDSIYDTDRRGRTALHLTADASQPALAVALRAARADVNTRDRDGYTPVDTAEYWAARAPLRAHACLATLAVLYCHEGTRSLFPFILDPAALVDVHRRLAAESRRSSLLIQWIGSPWAALGTPATPHPSPADPNPPPPPPPFTSSPSTTPSSRFAAPPSPPPVSLAPSSSPPAPLVPNNDSPPSA